MVNRVVQIRGINIHVKLWNEEASPTLVLLHGFTGSTETWRETVSFLPWSIKVVAVDLTGHGLTDAPSNPERYSMEEQISDLDLLFTELGIERFSLLGYSMGGRIALSYALQYPERVEGLILESSSPGLEDEEEQIQRANADNSLADRIESEGLEAFVDFWEAVPLFESQKTLSAEKRKAIREERLSQKPIGLANSLRGIGTGRQPSNWRRLNLLQLPVLLMVGEWDIKFRNIAEEMQKRLPTAKIETVREAGHAIHVEKPEQFATIITELF